MLKGKLLHPEILSALAGNGHGSRVLIADGNFPVGTRVPASGRKVFLNLAPGMPTVTDVLKVLCTQIPVESYMVMTPPDGAGQPIHEEFSEILGAECSSKKLNRFDFYAESASADTCLAIATGETRRFANILLVIGVVC